LMQMTPQQRAMYAMQMQMYQQQMQQQQQQQQQGGMPMNSTSPSISS